VLAIALFLFQIFIRGFCWQQINEKPQVIQEYESGKAIPNQQIISKLEKVLGTKLRGKK
jgi:ribosome-binding protein aMBF1 (putative translation factor)